MSRPEFGDTDLIGRLKADKPAGKRKPVPRGYFASPGSGPAGQLCETCAYCVLHRQEGKDWYKCQRMQIHWTKGRATDIDPTSAACLGWSQTQRPQPAAYDLYNGVPGHVKGSETSREAAVRTSKTVNRTQTIVLEYLRSRGSDGATSWEVERDCQMRHQTASARLRELVQKGLARDTERRRPTDTGCKAKVRVAT